MMNTQITRQNNLNKKYLASVFLIIFSILFVSIFNTGKTDAAACTVPSPSYGTDVMSVVIPQATKYSIWVDIKVPSTTANSILLDMDGTNCYNVGGAASITPGTWTWVNYQNADQTQVMQQSLSQSTHTATLIGTQPGVAVSELLFLGDPTCVPVGDGSNCASSSAVTVSVPSSLNRTNSTFNSISMSWNASTVTGGTLAGYEIDDGTGKKLGTSTTTSYVATGLTPNTSYSFIVKAYDSSPTPVFSPDSTPLVYSSNKIGDLDGDGLIGGHDLSILVANYNTNYPSAEFDGTNIVEAHDLSLLVGNYGK